MFFRSKHIPFVDIFRQDTIKIALLEIVNPTVERIKKRGIAVVVIDSPTQRLFHADIQLGVEAFQADRRHAGHIFFHHSIVDLPRRDGFHQVDTIEAVAFHYINSITNLVRKMLQQFHLVAALWQVYGLTRQID